MILVDNVDKVLPTKGWPDMKNAWQIWRNPAPEKHYSERHSGSLLRISGISPVKLRCAHGHAPLAPLRTLSGQRTRVLMCYMIHVVN